MLWINHRLALVKLGASTPEFYREVRLEINRFLRLLARRAKACRPRERELEPARECAPITAINAS
jgi:hypothetical protein